MSALASISEQPGQRLMIVTSGALGPLISLLHSGHSAQIRLHAVITLAHLTEEDMSTCNKQIPDSEGVREEKELEKSANFCVNKHVAVRTRMLEMGVFEQLVEAINSTSPLTRAFIHNLVNKEVFDKDVVENNGLFLGSMSVSLPEYKTPQVLNVDRATPDRSPSKSSKVKRTLKVNIMLDWREYEANDGKKQSEAEEIINLNVVADTGADMCCTLPNEALKMGFKPKQLFT